MSGFLYFVPDKQSITAMDLIETGLDKVLDDVIFTTRTTISGPGGGGGILISGKGAGAKELYFRPQTQAWQKAINDKYYIGIYSDAMPSPAELAREEIVDGYSIELAEFEWTIPLARIFPKGTGFPKSLLMGSDGKLIEKIIPKYVSFCDKCEILWDDFNRQIGLIDGEPQLTNEQLWQIAAEALNINYHIWFDEVNILELFNTMSLKKIFEALIDYPVFEAFLKRAAESQKKNCSQDISASGQGQPVSG